MAKLKAQEIHKMDNVWENTVMLFILDVEAGVQNVLRYVKVQWTDIIPKRIMPYKDSCFLVQFKSSKDVDKVIAGGPYSMNRKPVVVKQWHAGFDTNKEIFKSFLVWVQFKGLTLSYWR